MDESKTDGTDYQGLRRRIKRAGHRGLWQKDTIYEELQAMWKHEVKNRKVLGKERRVKKLTER